MKKNRTGYERRSAARLAAVQAIYQMEMSGAGPESVLREQAERARDPEADFSMLGEPDPQFLGDLVRGVHDRREDLDRMIGAALSKEWPLARLEAVLRAILRAGAWELLSRPDIDAAVVITEYVRIAEAFFEGGEPKLVNGVLDKLATTLRKPEETGQPDGSDAG
ncbi:MAG: transcription antitermination factor NusB [Alphaproteobacteria bacterium]|nr:transcription antitermination factor NusB [Alphaproteobacteria bacterium]